MNCDVLIIGGGAAGLMAADTAMAEGARVMLAEAKPSLARKVLMAGKSGLNITKDEELALFLSHYEGEDIKDYVREFPPAALRAWFDGYGAESFVGSSGKVFPKVMKASPFLRAWIHDLKERGLEIKTRWRWMGERPDDLCFETPEGERWLEAKAIVFALGGGSWPKLGSDGAWVERFPSRALRAANMGVNVDWSDKMTPFFGAWIKNIRAHCGDAQAKGEIGVTRYGLEGGAIYALSSHLHLGKALVLDFLPRMTMDELGERARNKGKMSLANFLRKLGLSDAARAMFFECSHSRNWRDIKELKVNISSVRPLQEAISSAGGVRFDALDKNLSMRQFPHVFVAGEMLDWSAPTGGYLLNACFATGRVAGQEAARFALAS